jgi:hypothetical protein
MTLKRILVVGLGLLAVVSTASATDLTGQLSFVGITPCRIVQTFGTTFTGQAGPPSLVASADRTFQMTGTVPGVPAQCGIPTAAVAISVNFTVTGFSAQGDLRVRPAGAALGSVSIINYQLENIANATIVPLGPSGGGENGITIHCDAAGTDFIADVNGYFIASTAPQLLTQVCGTNDVSIGGHCYYMDGSKGVCDPGYQVASQSILTTIHASFAGLNWKHTIPGNCCIFNADPNENWGMSVHCGSTGPFTAGDVALGAVGCTNQTNFFAAQQTLCGK